MSCATDNQRASTALAEFPVDGLSSVAPDSLAHRLAATVRAIAGSSDLDCALDIVFEFAKEAFGAVTVCLELEHGAAVKHITRGTRARRRRGVELATVVFDVPCVTGPSGTLAIECAVGAPTAALDAVAVPLGLWIDRDALARRANDADEKAKRRISEVGTIYEIGQAIDQIEVRRLLQMITERAAVLMDAQACSLMLVNEETKTLKVAASVGLPEAALEQEHRLGEGISGRVAETEQPLRIVGGVSDSRLDGINVKNEVSSSMLVPMKGRDRALVGVLSIRRHHPSPDFTEEDQKLFSVFAKQAALAVTNVRLYADLKRSAAELLKISTLSRALISTLDLDELLARVADDIRGVVGFERCLLFMRDAQKSVYVPTVWRGYPDKVGRNPVKEGEGVVGAVGKSKGLIEFDVRDIVPEEERKDRGYLQMLGFARSLGADAFVAVPILTSQNRCIGVVVADNRGKREPITREQKSLLSAFVNQAGIAIENARLYEEMQENYRNIHRLKNYTDNVLQSIGAGIVSTDARGYIARWNRAAEETLKQPPAFFRDALISELVMRLSLPDGERDHLLGIIHRVVETGERIHLHKLKLNPADRAPIALNLMLSRLTDHNRERAGVVLIFEDVTQEVRLEAEVEKMRRLADIGQLAAKMAHEVRNALSPIRGAAQIIRVELEDKKNAAEWPDIIIAEVDNLSRLTSEMLDFARPTQLDPRPVLVNEFLLGAVQSLSTFLTEHHVAVQWGVPVDLPELLADPVQLGQVVRNIVMNAAQAMPEGGELFIHGDFDQQTRTLAIRFRDTGVGIPKEEIDRIFRPFVTTKTKGTGLGLPIVQKIVDHHGGRVEVESRLGEGTCFSVLLPLKPSRDKTELSVEEIPLISARPAGPFPDKA